MSVKKIIITILVLIAALAVVTGLLILADRLLYVPDEQPTVNSHYYDIGGITEISVSASYGYVNIMRTSAADIMVESVDSGRGLYTVEEPNGSGTLAVNGKKLPWYDTLRHIESERYGVTIMIPDDYSGVISISADGGGIDVTGVSADELIISGRLGNISISSVTADKISIQADVADVNIDMITAGMLDISTSIGDVEFSAIAIDKSLSIVTETGDIDGTIMGSREEFTVTASTQLGDCSLDASDNISGSEKICKLQADVGDIEVYFE